MATAANLKFVLSGGAANTDPSLALGGAASTAAGGVIGSQSLTTSAISGVTYDDAAGNTVGVGTVTYTLTGQTLQWTPPGGTIGPAIAVGTNGVYALYGSNYIGHIKVTVVAASLPGGNTTHNPTVANQTNKLFDDVARAESVAGDIEYRCFYVKNAHASDSMTGILLWIDTDTNGGDSLSIGLDPAGAGGTATTIVNEDTAPSGVVFTTPTSELDALGLGTLTFGQVYPVWIRRTVPVATAGTVTADASRLKLRFV